MASARWAYHVAKDPAAFKEPVSAGKRDSLLEGRSLAVEDARDDDDLALQVGRLIDLCEDCVDLDLGSVANRASSIKTILACASDVIKEKDKKSSFQGWKNWLDDDADEGCRRAQKYSKLPEACKPSEVTTPEGVLSCVPIELMEAERDKFKDLWKAEDAPEAQRRCKPDAFRTGSQEMKRHSASNFWEAAKTFSCTTASTYDGFHPRHFDGLSDKARTALGVLLDTCEDIGEWRDGINAAVPALIPKAEGGLRPIGLFRGVYRLWARARGPEAAGWERTHDRAYFSDRESNGALDTVWDQAFRAERNTADGSAAASVLVDMKRFYEHFDHGLLKKRAENTGFVEKLTALALARHRAPRYITNRGKLTAAIHPKRDVITGCGFATTWVKV